jgi:hypothetical protein
MSETESFITPSLPFEMTKSLLESKRPDIAEIELTLFENCNIVCDFCFHDKKSEVGLTKEEMFSKISIIDEFLRKQVGKVDLVQINLVGGELLQDRWMKDLCDKYLELLVEIQKTYFKFNLKMKVVVVSNFLFKKRDVVKDLLDQCRASNINTHLIASYDFDGRPISPAFTDNISYFGPDYICSINLVGTSQSIKKFMLQDDVYFDYLYNNFNIYFDDFIPDPGADESIPSDREFFEWYKFIAIQYPKTQPVHDLITNENNKMHCLSLNKITIFPDNRTSNCRWHRYSQKDFSTELNMKDNAGMMQRFLDENDCLSCEYFSKCGFRCFTQWDWKNRKKDMDTCPMKEFYRFLDTREESALVN